MDGDEVEALRLFGDLGLQLVVEEAVLDDVDQVILLDLGSKGQLLGIAVFVGPGPVLTQ